MHRKPRAAVLLFAIFVAMLLPALPVQSVLAQTEPSSSNASEPATVSANSAPAEPIDTAGSGGPTGLEPAATEPGETTAAEPKQPDAASPAEPSTWFGWFWHLPDDKSRLDRAAVLTIALLAAFLTVLQIWRVPSQKSMFVKEEPEDNGKAQSGGDEDKNLNFYFLQNNVGRAAISGLGGMIALTFLQSLWDSKEVNAKSYYVVCFVLFFVSLLLAFAFAQACNEALRSRLVHHRWSVTWTVFFDTFFTFLQGKNQLKTGPFTQEILQLQAANLRTVDEVCKQIFKAIRGRFKEVDADFNLDQLSDYGVRVSVSVLSRDRQSTYYVSKPSGSLSDAFDKGTMAWLAIYTGQALWWRNAYDPASATGKQFQASLALPRQFPELLDPGSGEAQVSGEARVIDPRTFHSDTRDSDYEAYVVIPVPLRRRTRDETDVRAGIHISFRKQEWLNLLWERDLLEPALPAPTEKPAEKPKDAAQQADSNPADKPTQADKPTHAIAYQDWQQVLGVRADSANPFGRRLYEADKLLSDLLRNFNEKLFESTLRPRIEAQR